MNIHTYLVFNGNCREAMTFYHHCLGGKLHFQTIGDSPMSDRMPKKMRDYVLHATLIKEDLTLMASDMADENGLLKGNTVLLMLFCSNQKEIETCYTRLSRGGKQTQPVELTFWGSLLGSLTDKYGNHWLLQYQKD
jgi:PhnB protein